MESMQIDFINPKAKKIVLELESIGLIKLSKVKKTNDSIHELSNEFIEKLDAEYELFKSGKGKFYSMNEVFGKYLSM